MSPLKSAKTWFATCPKPLQHPFQKAVPQNDLLKTATNIMEDSPILGQLHLQNDDPQTIQNHLISSSIFKQTCSHAKSHDLLVPSTILHNGSGGSPPPLGLAHPKRSTSGWSISDLCEPEPEVARDTEPYFLSCRVFFHFMLRVPLLMWRNHEKFMGS